MRKGIDDCFGGNVLDRHCHRPPSETVDHGQEMPEPIGEWKRDDVNVEVLEASLRHRKFANPWDSVARHLRLLTRDTFSGPASDVCIHRRPDELSSDCLACAFDAGMSKIVESIEDSPSPGKGHDGSCWPVRHVHDKFCSIQVDSLEMETGVSVADSGLVVSVERLVPCHLL